MKSQKGMFLISAFLVLAVIETLAGALFLRNLTQMRATERAQNRITAFQIAESGLDLAITQLRNDRAYNGAGYTVLGRGGYQVTVATPLDPLGNPIDPTLRRITSTGHVPAQPVIGQPLPPSYMRRQVVAFVSLADNGPFNFAAFGDSTVSITVNAQTDSYDSRKGPYITGNSDGDVATNAIAPGSINLSSNAQVNGDATVGPGGDPSTAITVSPNASITGNRSAAPHSIPLNPVQIPPGLKSSGVLSVCSIKKSLPGGTYLYDSIEVCGDGLVEFEGPATVYVKGYIWMDHGSVITAVKNIPSQLQINVLPSQATPGGNPSWKQISLNGSPKIYGVLNAPQSDILMRGPGQIFGAVIGNNVTLSNGAQVHYDEALRAAGLANLAEWPVNLLSWQEF